jgi:NAD(P)-dependent dehydrogenase (short-subunit alcohol dehydrogenase family)
MTGHPSSLFNHPYKALVIGASGAIGHAFALAFEADPLCSYVHSISRKHSPGFDLLDQASLLQQAELSRACGPFHIIVDATGALSIDGVGPEKSLASLNPSSLTKSFEINAVAPALLIRYFAPLLESGPSIYAKLSARVGSISDNQKGGWYGYRAAKAALNMLLQTAALELQRKNPHLRMVALQPGTVLSSLSSAFVAAAPNVLTPQESVLGMLQALAMLSPKSGAHFVDYKGEAINW